MKKLRLAIFASGKGTNASNILKFFSDHHKIEVGVLVTNNPFFILPKQETNSRVKIMHLSSAQGDDASYLLHVCRNEQINYVILAGYLKLIPAAFIHAFEERVINIHPSLLPKYGGKGMYGDHVHKAVLAEKETVSGISIHIVNEEFDKGRLLAQFYCPILPGDGISDLKERIQKLEQAYYPVVIEKTLLQ